MSNSELNRAATLASSLKEHLTARMTSLAALGRRAYSGAVEAAASYVDRRKHEIALSVGTVAMIGGAGIAGLQGMAVAERQADIAADELYESIIPAHIVERQEQAEAMRTGSVAVAARADSDKVGMSVTMDKQESVPARAAVGLAGLVLVCVGATTSMLALRGRSRRSNDEPIWDEDPGWQVIAPSAFPDTDRTEGTPAATSVLYSMFDRPYRAPAFERFDEWCGRAAIYVGRACNSSATAVANGIAATVNSFNGWRADLRERREQQMAAYENNPGIPDNFAEYADSRSVITGGPISLLTP